MTYFSIGLIVFWPLSLWLYSLFLRYRKTSSGRFELQSVGQDLWLYRGHFSNSVVARFPSCFLVVDTQVSPGAARKMKKEISKIAKLPIKYVVNTHHHGDHTGGNGEFNDAVIISAEKTREWCITKDKHRIEYAESFGLIYDQIHEITLPTETFGGNHSLTIDGERVDLLHLGAGETEDAIVVHFPSRMAVAVGDSVVVKDFPFMGAPIHDEGLRDDGKWSELLENIAKLNPNILLPGHGPYLKGRQEIQARLFLLRDLFQDLFLATKKALGETSIIPEVIRRVKIDLTAYRNHQDLQDNVLGFEFGIYKALNGILPDREGKGWWLDLKPSVVTDDPLIEELLQEEKYGELAYYYMSQTNRFKIKVEATEYGVLAQAAARKQLSIDPNEPNALLVLGVYEAFSNVFLCQENPLAIQRLEQVLNSAKIPLRKRLLAAAMLTRTLQVHQGEWQAFKTFVKSLPTPLNIVLAPAYPVLKEAFR